MDIEMLWKQALEAVKQRGDFDLGFWQSLQAARPVVAEGGYFVVGYPPESGHLKPRLMEEFSSNLVTNILRGLSPELSEIRLRVIDGVSAEDWERVKELDEARRQHIAREAPRRAAAEGLSLSWETLSEQLSVRFSQMRAGRYPQTAAQFLLESFAKVQELESQGGDPEGLARRLGRAFNRLAGLTGIPAAQVALEYLRFKEGKG